MATTVTYKGATLTTVDNQTKTLQTAGTWMEDDLTLTDVSSGGTGEWSSEGIANRTEPYGEITLDSTVTSIRNYAFYQRPITRIYAPEITTVIDGACSQSGLTRIEPTDMPKLVAMTGGFESCASLTYVKLTGVVTAFQYAFRWGGNIEEAYFPNATANIDRTFQGCSKLRIMDCGSSNITNGNSFQNCTALRTLVLRKTSGVQTLAAWSANCMGGIYNNPTESTIYVPSALISSYQAASNWSSAYAAGVTFAAIEGSQYE